MSCSLLKDTACKRTMFEKKIVKRYDRTRKTGSERGQERKGVQERGSRGNK